MKKQKKQKKQKKCKKACKSIKCKCKGIKGIKVKGKRGRPRKEDKVKWGKGDKGDKIIIPNKYTANTQEAKEKYGKVSTECKGSIKIVKRGRGRPKKVRVTESDVIIVPTYTFKFLGFCPICKLSLTDGDLVNKGGNIISCQKCGKLLKLNELTKTIELDRPKTKKEYFQSVNSTYTWHDYNASSNINSVAKKEEPMLDEIEDEHVKSAEDDLISKKNIED